MKNALIIFTKNLIPGKVKTRLAATVGNDKALKIYLALIKHTILITKHFAADKIIFYADKIETNDDWKDEYKKQLQNGNDLGERMMHAFENVFQNDYTKAVIIGTDCPELNEEIILDAFEKLNEYDVVVGPAADGGYYLLGMKKLYQQLFENIEWSTNTVFEATINSCNKYHLNYYLLPTLHDVDEEKDLLYMKHLQ